MRSPVLMLAGLLCAIPIVLAAAPGADPDAAKRRSDEKLIAEYREGKKTVPYGFWSIHDDPKPGQSATFANAMGVERTYRVAFVRESVCTIERRLPGSDVVIAVEFELSGPIKNMVRRAWVGRVRQKPFAAEVQVPSGADSAVGLSGAAESSREEFVDLAVGGRKWSGELVTVRQWYSRDKAGEPDRMVRTWTSRENWFRQALRVESQVKDQDMEVDVMVSCSEASEPLLDWADVPAPTATENVTIRQLLLKKIAEKDLARLLSGHLYIGAVAGLHPGAEVGDWASFGKGRLTLVVRTDDRAVVEYLSDDGLDLCEALEFEVIDDKAGAVVARYAGIKGQRPHRAEYRHHPDERVLIVENGEPENVKVAGHEWQARAVREQRKDSEAGKVSHIKELLVSETAPFNQPLQLKIYRVEYPDQAYTQELTAFGKDGAPALDWSQWKPAQAWKAPFTAEQVKAFIKVGMKWKYKQEIETEDGLAVFIQQWEVTEVDEHGYKCLCKSEGPDNLNAEMTDHLTWDGYIARIELIAQGTVSERELKLNDRTIKVVLFKGKFFRRDVLFGLSPDLPGVRICTEEDLGGASRVWLTEFHDPPAEKKDD